MSEKDLQALEQLVTARSQGSFTPGSELGFYFALLEQLREALTPAFHQLLEKFAVAYPSSALLPTIKLRALLKQYDEETAPEQKAHLLARLNTDFLGLAFDALAPTTSSEATTLYPSELNPNLVAVDVAKAEKEIDYFRSLNTAEYQLLSVNRMSDEVFGEFAMVADIHLFSEFVPRLARELESNPSSPALYSVSRLTLEQIQELATLCPSLQHREEVVSELYLRLFPVPAAPKYKVEVLLKALEWSSSLPPKFVAYRKQLLFDILTLKVSSNEYDELLFLEYLKLHGAAEHFVTRETHADCEIPKSTRSRECDGPLIDTYLEKILAVKENVNQFSPYLSSEFLNESFARAKILSGSDPTTLSLPTSKLEALAQEVVLELAPDNPSTLTRSSEVTLRLYTKNVPKLIVHVLELNPLSYSLAHGSSIPESIAFEGLEPTHREVFDFSSDSVFVKRLRDVPLPLLSGKAGLFAVEFFGNGLHARALIKKGFLKLVSKVTAAGHQMTVLNEQNEVCTSPGSGIYIDSRFYELNESTKHVAVPFTGAERTNTAVITDGTVCDTVYFQHRAENYELKCSFVVMEESLQAGVVAPVSLTPKLFVSGLPGPKELMKDVSVTIATQDLDGISSSKTHSQLSIPKDEIVTVDFEVPTKATSVSILFSCSVKPISSSTPQTLTASRSFQINQNSGKQTSKQLFLRKSTGSYYVQLLGKNGEACAKEVVSVKLISRRSIPDVLLSTNEFGLVKLGGLEGVSAVSVALLESGSACGVANYWSLDNFEPVVQYPSTLILCEGDSFGLPFARKGDKSVPLSPFEVELLSVSEDGRLKSASANLNYDSEREVIVLTGLAEGNYSVVFGSKYRIEVQVLKGTHWGNNQYILTDTKVIQTYKQYRSLLVSSAERVENSLRVKLAGDFEEAVVHVLLHRFLSGSVKETYSKFAETTQGRPSDAISNPENKNKYLESRAQGGEHRYVLERKLQEKFTGNNLPKPQLLIRPIDTRISFSESHLRDSSPHMYADYCSNRCAPIGCRFSGMPPRSSFLVIEQSNNIDFLLSPAIVKLSCPVSEDGVASIPLPEQGYSVASIIALNSDSTAYYVSDFGDLSLSTKDLALRLTLDLAKKFAETRKCSVLRSGEELVIADIAAASLQVIDSIDKLSQLLVQVSKLSGSGLDVQEWEFLGRWHTLSAEEKNKKYDKYYSHELNLFIFMKDPQYFESVVKPFVSAKMEKTIVDDYLLGNSLDKYLYPEAINRMNALEKVLLVQRSKCQGLIDTISNQAKVLPQDEAAEQKLFDAVLKFNLAGDDKDELAQFLAEEKRAAEIEAARRCEESKEGFGALHAEKQCEALCMPLAPSLSQCSVPAMNQPVCNMAHPPLRTEAMCFKRCAAPTKTIGCAPLPGAESKMATRSFGMLGSAGAPKARGERFKADEVDLAGFEDAEYLAIRDREAQRPYFQQMDATKEYAETHYYSLKNHSEFASRVPLSLFWAELAEGAATGKTSNLGVSVLHTTSNLTAYVAALAFTDLPLQSSRHGFLTQGLGVRIKAASNCLVFHKSMDEAADKLQDTVLCAQRFFHPKERYVTNAAGEKEEKPVKEFVAGVIYGSQVIVTNVSVVGLPAHVLVQVPEGAIPVSPLDYTKSHLMLLKSYETKTIEYFFYFPTPGNFIQAPVHVSVSGEVVSVTNPFKFHVVTTRSLLSSDSLTDIAATGDIDLVVEFLKTHSPHTPQVGSDLNSTLWMLRDKAKYSKLIAALRELQYFHREIWAFALAHVDEQAVAELLESENDLQDKVGFFFSSSLLRTREGESRHFDYSPMVNARAYQVASQPRIVNQQFKDTYYRFLFALAHKPVLDSADYMALIQYLLYQDRIPEAKRLLPKVGLQPSEGKPGRTPLQLQFDYLMCYLDAEVAQRVSLLYAEYPITKWREIFELVRKQFEDDKEERVQEELSTSLSFGVEKGKVKLAYTNLSQVFIRVYEIDIEVLFSRNPFFMKDTELFTYVCPYTSYQVDLDPRSCEHEFSLDDKWTHLNIFVEVEFEGKKLFQTYFSTSLTTQVIEQYGLVHVLDQSSIGVPRTYVKVFSKEKSGQIVFYKDGYTDVRGKFDYVSLNTNQLDKVESFAILITHDSLGSAIVTAKPPPK